MPEFRMPDFNIQPMPPIDISTGLRFLQQQQQNALAESQMVMEAKKFQASQETEVLKQDLLREQVEAADYANSEEYRDLKRQVALWENQAAQLDYKGKVEDQRRKDHESKLAQIDSSLASIREGFIPPKDQNKSGGGATVNLHPSLGLSQADHDTVAATGGQGAAGEATAMRTAGRWEHDATQWLTANKDDEWVKANSQWLEGRLARYRQLQVERTRLISGYLGLDIHIEDEEVFPVTPEIAQSPTQQGKKSDIAWYENKDSSDPSQNVSLPYVDPYSLSYKTGHDPSFEHGPPPPPDPPPIGLDARLHGGTIPAGAEGYGPPPPPPTSDPGSIDASLEAAIGLATELSGTGEESSPPPKPTGRLHPDAWEQLFTNPMTRFRPNAELVEQFIAVESKTEQTVKREILEKMLFGGPVPKESRKRFIDLLRDVFGESSRPETKKKKKTRTKAKSPERE